jgi:hypothetical protein
MTDPAVEIPDVLLTSIQDGVVAERTRMCYVSEIFSFLNWCRLNEPTVLTEHGERIMSGFILGSPVDCSVQKVFNKNKKEFDDYLREASSCPVFYEDVLTPEVYMNYCRGLRNKKTRLYLGKSTIGVKRSAIFHLFRLQNGAGYNEAFKLGLNNLFRGFFRVLTSRRTSSRLIVEDGGTQSQSKWNQVSLFFFFFLHNVFF